jgi:hypothetical protein
VAGCDYHTFHSHTLSLALALSDSLPLALSQTSMGGRVRAEGSWLRRIQLPSAPSHVRRGIERVPTLPRPRTVLRSPLPAHAAIRATIGRRLELRGSTRKLPALSRTALVSAKRGRASHARDLRLHCLCRSHCMLHNAPRESGSPASPLLVPFFLRDLRDVAGETFMFKPTAGAPKSGTCGDPILEACAAADRAPAKAVPLTDAPADDEARCAQARTHSRTHSPTNTHAHTFSRRPTCGSCTLAIDAVCGRWCVRACAGHRRLVRLR